MEHFSIEWCKEKAKLSRKTVIQNKGKFKTSKLRNISAGKRR